MVKDTLGARLRLYYFGLVLASLPELIVEFCIIILRSRDAEYVINRVSESRAFDESSVKVGFVGQSHAVEVSLLTAAAAMERTRESAVGLLELESAIYRAVYDIRTLFIKKRAELFGVC